VQAVIAAQASRIQSGCSIAGAPYRRGFNSLTVGFYDRTARRKVRQPQRWHAAATIKPSVRQTRDTLHGRSARFPHQRTRGPPQQIKINMRDTAAARRGVLGMLFTKLQEFRAIVDPTYQPPGTRHLLASFRHRNASASTVIRAPPPDRPSRPLLPISRTRRSLRTPGGALWLRKKTEVRPLAILGLVVSTSA
jgi:hypothetical protein